MRHVCHSISLSIGDIMQRDSSLGLVDISLLPFIVDVLVIIVISFIIVVLFFFIIVFVFVIIIIIIIITS